MQNMKIQNIDNFIRWKGKNHVFIVVRPDIDVLNHLYEHLYDPREGPDFLIEHQAEEREKWLKEVDKFNKANNVNFMYKNIHGR